VNKLANNQVNISFFSDNKSYQEEVENLETYKNIAKEITKSINGAVKVLDMGNGGFVNYKIPSSVRYIKAVDICIKKNKKINFKHTIIDYKYGDVLSYKDSNKYDAVIMQNFLHHVVGENIKENYILLERAIKRMAVKTKRGGKLIILESTVPFWFELIEMILFLPAKFLVPLFFKHPVTFQYTPKTIEQILKKNSKNVVVRAIKHGEYQLMFGKKIPSNITPAKMKLFLLQVK